MSTPLSTTNSEWIQTASGRQFWPLDPKSEDVLIEDIAHALAAVNRFNGHAREPFSVAQHSVLVSVEMEKEAIDSDALDWAPRALYGLLHDASEAYLCDVPRPLKRLAEFEPYRVAEARLQAVVYLTFGLDPESEPLSLKAIDRRMLRTEQKYLMPPAAHGERRNDVSILPIAIRPWPFAFAKGAFLNRFQDLQAARGARS